MEALVLEALVAQAGLELKGHLLHPPTVELALADHHQQVITPVVVEAGVMQMQVVVLVVLVAVELAH
jgi:hypothetical protein